MSNASGRLGSQSKGTGDAVAALTFGATAWAAASVVVMTYGTQLNWPDYVHVDFGFPMTFATHTLNTIAGPVDRWDVNLGALIVDLFFWLGGVIAIFAAGLGYLTLRRKRDATVTPRGPGGGGDAMVTEWTETEASPNPQGFRARELGGE